MSTAGKKIFSFDRTYPLSKALVDARNAAGITQLELAEAIGTHKSHISRWERGKFEPSSDYLEKISSVLNCTFVSTYGVDSNSKGSVQRIIAAREALGDLTQAELAAIIGVATDEIQSVENGTAEPTDALIDSFSKAGVSPDWIRTGQGSMLAAVPSGDRRTIGERMLVAMKHRGVSQTQLAEGIDNSLSGVNLWINDKREPRPSSIRAVADFLKVSPLWLRTGSGPMDPQAEDPETEQEVEIVKSVANQVSKSHDDALLNEVTYLTKLVKEIRASGEDIPEAVKKRLIAAIDNLLDD